MEMMRVLIRTTEPQNKGGYINIKFMYFVLYTHLMKAQIKSGKQNIVI